MKTILFTAIGVVVALGLFESMRSLLLTGQVQDETINTTFWSLCVIWIAFLGYASLAALGTPKADR